MVQLGECCTIVSGATPKTGVAEYWDGDIAWATPADLSGLPTLRIATTARAITAAGLRSCSSVLLPPGSVLFSSRAPIGHVAINTVPMATNQGFKSLVPKPDMADPGFLAHWLRANKGYLQSLGSGATFKEVSKSVVEQVKVPLPELSEQRRIAAILDQADTLRLHGRQYRNSLDAAHCSVFKEMFGADHWRAVTTSSRGRNTNGWSWELLTDVARLATGHTPDRNKPEYWDGEIPWVSLPDIRKLDGSTAFDTALRVTPAGIRNSSSVVLPAGTVAFSRTASIGFVTKFGRAMATSQDFHNWVPSNRLDSDYLMAALRYSREHLLGVSNGSTHQTIYQRAAQGFRVLMPPMSLQRHFGAVSQALDLQRAAAQRSLTSLDELFASLQSRAFWGRL